MVTLIIAAAGITVAAIAVTIYAYATAKNGFEDEEGFHAITSVEQKPADSAAKKRDDELTLFPEPHSH